MAIRRPGPPANSNVINSNFQLGGWVLGVQNIFASARVLYLKDGLTSSSPISNYGLLMVVCQLIGITNWMTNTVHGLEKSLKISEGIL